METSSSGAGNRTGDIAEAGFQKTRWSLVLKAGAGSDQALDDLARSYWPAVYAFLRRKGYSPEDAEDITQDTLTRLLTPERLSPVNPTKGRFRSFLCACAAHEAAHLRDRNTAKKRGGSQMTSLESLKAEEVYKLVPSFFVQAEQVFDQAWSQIVISRALNKLNADYRRLGKADIYLALLPLLNAGPERGGHDLLAEQLGMTPINVRVTWTRFKASFVQHLRNEVAETVTDPADLETELRHLLHAWLGGGG